MNNAVAGVDQPATNLLALGVKRLATQNRRAMA
jgi:hypothetical protein